MAKAGGQLQVLDLTGQTLGDCEFHHCLLLEVFATNAATLTELHLDTAYYWSPDSIRTLLVAAPALQLFAASVLINDRHVARAMLRNEPPFQALQIQDVSCHLDATADVVALCSDLRCHASLVKLHLCNAKLNTAAAMSAVVDACIALRPRKLWLGGCCAVPAVLSQLTRLISAGALRELVVYNDGVEMFDAAHESTRLFVAAVHASAMTRLRLINLGVTPEDVVEAEAFINDRRH